MVALARYGLGRILLHLLAMLRDREVRFHVAGITRELPSAAEALSLLEGMRREAIAAWGSMQPVKRYSAATTKHPRR